MFPKDGICHILSSRVESSESIGFDSYGYAVMVDNSANGHIFSEEDTLTNTIEAIISNGVANIGRRYLIPKGIGTVTWYWNYDEGQLHTNKQNNLI